MTLPISSQLEHLRTTNYRSEAEGLYDLYQLLQQRKYEAASTHIEQHFPTRLALLIVGRFFLEGILEGEEPLCYEILLKVIDVLEENAIQNPFANMCKLLAWTKCGDFQGYQGLLEAIRNPPAEDSEHIEVMVCDYWQTYSKEGQQRLRDLFFELHDEFEFVDDHQQLIELLEKVQQGTYNLADISKWVVDPKNVQLVTEHATRYQILGGIFLEPGKIGDLFVRLRQEIEAVQRTGNLLSKPTLAEVADKV